jgi:formylglycine-generating enzyme required for sulfatase activity
MSGNVYEWMSDWYDDGGYYARSPRENPTGPGSGERRVLRGGSWYVDNSDFLRAADRDKYIPDGRLNGGGFRCALSY